MSKCHSSQWMIFGPTNWRQAVHETLQTSLTSPRLSNLYIDEVRCGGEFRTTFRTIPIRKCLQIQQMFGM